MGLARIISSTSIAIRLRYNIEVGFINTSPKEMVGNSSLPDDLETWDQRSGRFAQWYRDSRSLSAQLRGDAVRMQLMLDGRYRVTAGLASRVKRVRPVPVDLGEIEVSLVPGSGPLEVKVNFDPQAVQAAAAELARREAGNE